MLCGAMRCCVDAALIYYVDVALYYVVVMWMWCVGVGRRLVLGYLGGTTNRQRCQMIRTTSHYLVRGLLLSSSFPSFFHYISSSSN